MDYALYIASALGGLALYLLMPRRGYNPWGIGALLGVMALGGLWLFLTRHLDGQASGGLRLVSLPYYYIFSAVAIVSAVRVITHTQPVHAALWFIMVILASAGLLLVLGAEFVAFALVIVYAGAILVTYVFVIMLAQHANDQAAEKPTPEPTESPVYDRVAYELLAGVVTGFFLLALLLRVAFHPEPPNPYAAGPSDERIIAEVLTDRPVTRLISPLDAGGFGGYSEGPGGSGGDRLDNAERIGLDLLGGHPLAMELAGVILLVSLVGAVVISRTRCEPVVPESATRGVP